MGRRYADINLKEVDMLLQEGLSFFAVASKIGVSHNAIRRKFRRVYGEAEYEMAKSSKGRGGGPRKGAPSSLKGRTLTEEHKRRISKSRTGRRHSEETKRRISKSRTGRRHSEETKRRISETGAGRKFSEEHKRRISEARTGRKYPRLVSSEVATGEELEESDKDFKGLGSPKDTVVNGRRRLSPKERKRHEQKMNGQASNDTSPEERILMEQLGVGRPLPKRERHFDRL